MTCTGPSMTGWPLLFAMSETTRVSANCAHRRGERRVWFDPHRAVDAKRAVGDDAIAGGILHLDEDLEGDGALVVLAQPDVEPDEPRDGGRHVGTDERVRIAGAIVDVEGVVDHAVDVRTA